jgi:hypothetical protein
MKVNIQAIGYITKERGKTKEVGCKPEKGLRGHSHSQKVFFIDMG